MMSSLKHLQRLTLYWQYGTQVIGHLQMKTTNQNNNTCTRITIDLNKLDMV